MIPDSILDLRLQTVVSNSNNVLRSNHPPIKEKFSMTKKKATRRRQATTTEEPVEIATDTPVGASGLNNRRRRRMQRREIRREAFDFIRENPDTSEEALKEHLQLEFADDGRFGFDPAIIILIMEIIKIVMAWWSNRS